MAEQSFTNLDFEEAKANLKNYLKSQEQFADYDFEGSNINVLLDILAYNTFQNNFYTHMALSEMFLDSAQVRDSIISHAKELNYLPRSRRSSQAIVSIEFNPTTNPASITIPERTKFIARCGSKTFSFYTADAYSVIPSSNGQYSIDGVEIYEGRIVNEYFEVDGTSDQRFVLQNDKIDTQSVEVFIKDSSSDITQTEYTFRSNIYDVDSTDTVFYLQAYRDNLYELVFGDNSFGNQPTNGNIIHVRYRVTNGEDANGINTFDLETDIDGISSVETTQSASSGGSEREGLESIRFFAPKSIQIQERAITEKDYAVLLKNQFPEIRAVSVYGGEKLDPPQFGRVVVAVYVNDDGDIRSAKADEYQEFLIDRTALTIEPIIKAAQFMYINVIADVNYSTSKTAKTAGSIENIVRNAIASYSDIYLEDFGKKLRASRLAANVDASDTSITSTLLDFNMVIEFEPTRNSPENFVLEFSNKLNPDVTYTDSQVGTYSPTVWSTPFVYENNTVLFRDNGTGRLDLIKSTGSDVSIFKRSVGRVNYTTGKVTINSITIQDYTTSIKMYAKPKTNNISPPNDRLIVIRETDIDVNAYGVRE